uniref:Putative retinitis pigmentosa gtpase regulator b n=1 Tax=Ixodes ricinus TaxID=34613 RepID=A0A0K8RFJ6_IXORI
MQDYGFVKKAEDALDKKESDKEDIRELKNQVSALKEEASDAQQASVVSDAEMVPLEAISRKSSQVLASAEMAPDAEPLTAEDISAGESHGDHEAFLTTAENEDAKKEHPSLPKSKPEQVTEKEMPDIPGEAKPMQQFVEPEVIKGKIFQAAQPDDGSFSSESLVEKDFLEHAKRKDEEEQKADESLGDVCDIPVGSEGFEEAEIEPSDVASRPVEHLPTDEDIQLHARETPSTKENILKKC